MVRYRYSTGKREEIKVGDKVKAPDCKGNGVKAGVVYKVYESAGLCIGIGCICRSTWVKQGGEEMTKIVWEVIIVDRTNDEIVIRETIVDGDEKSACSKVSINHANKLKTVPFENLAYITKELGSFESKEKEEDE